MFIRINKALAASREKRDNNEGGFTLIELLVVVLIIGVLSAIAIPIFLGQQNNAKDAAAKADLANSKTAVIAYSTNHDGTYPANLAAVTPAVQTELNNNGFIEANVSFVTYGSAFCLTRTGASAWSISSALAAPVNNATCTP